MADRPHGRPLLRRGRRRTGRRRQVPVAAARAVALSAQPPSCGPPVPFPTTGPGPVQQSAQGRAQAATSAPNAPRGYLTHHPAPPRAVTGRYGSPSGRRANVSTVEIAALAKPLNAAGAVRRSQKKTGTLPAGSVPVNESSLVGANCYAASPFDGPVLIGLPDYLDPRAAGYAILGIPTRDRQGEEASSFGIYVQDYQIPVRVGGDEFTTTFARGAIRGCWAGVHKGCRKASMRIVNRRHSSIRYRSLRSLRDQIRLDRRRGGARRFGGSQRNSA